MFKEQIDKFKNIFKNENGNNKRKIESLVSFVIILIITIVVINMILNPSEEKENTALNTTSVLAKQESKTSNAVVIEDDLETRLEQILSKIEGVGNVKVLLTYSQTSQTVAMYNEDTSISDTEEEDSRWRKQKNK